jgi:triacylglycerol lipase
VVLLHGTFSTVASNFGALVPALRAAGRCVYGFDYGLSGTRPVADSARSVSAFIDTVLADTGADQVDVIGFSQGGLVLRTALRQDGTAAKVAVAVLIAPSFHGTTSALLDALPAGACPACADQAADSALLTELNAGGDLDGDVRYAVVSTESDTVVTPVASQVPNGPPDRVRSLLVQDRCPGKRVDHVTLPADAGVIAWTVAALETGGTPDPTALTCG